MKMTVEQLRGHGFEYQYRITERIGHESASFYYTEHEYDKYMQEIARAEAANVLVEYGARFIKLKAR